MSLPEWQDIPEKYKEMLLRLAGSFGASGPKVDEHTFPTEHETKSIAIEMYHFSKMVIEDCIKEKIQ
jgi:hypothetical protein